MINQIIRNLLRLKYFVLLFCVASLSVNATVLPENLAKTRAAASQGFVLLKNNQQALPLQANEKIVVLGNRSFYNKIMFSGYQKSGGGSGDVYGSPVTDIYNGLLNLEKKGRIQVNKEHAQGYKTHLFFNKLIPNEKTFSDAQINALAKNNDTLVLTIGRSSSELFDHYDKAGDFYLSKNEIKLLEQVKKAQFKKVIVLLNIGTQMDLTWIDKYNIDAAMIVWFPGAEGGNAIADTLIGDVTPSGKLTASFAKSYKDYPTYGTYHESDDFVNYYEDIFLGYRYFETFQKQNSVLYPFGFGLSYTQFSVSNPVVVEQNNRIEVTTTVTNTGNYKGKEVVQVYYRAPQAILGNPSMELGAFAKTKLLNPGESQTLEMSFDINEMKSYDDLGKIQKSAYILEAGNYDVFVGNSVANARNNGVAYTHQVANNIIVKQLSEQVAPNSLAKRLTATGQYESLVKKPISSTPSVIKVEAEDSLKRHPWLSVETFNDGNYQGRALSKMADFLNTWAYYEVNIPKAGSYDLVLRAANGHGEIKDMLEVEVNGIRQDNVHLDVPKTGNGLFKGQWHNYINTAVVKLNLSQGKQFIKLKSKNNGFANLDYFTLSASSSNLPAVLPQQSFNRTYKLIDVQKNVISMDRFISQLSNADMANLLGGKLGTLKGNTGGIGGNDKFGIPAAQTADGPAGIRLTSGGTAWPVAVLFASSWDVDLLEEFGRSAAKEADFNGVDIWLTPGMNIQRDPLCGRNFEYFSEDPLITSEMASAVVRGAESQGILVTVKHFIANNKEGNRNSSDSRMSERALREIYLKAFEGTIKDTNPGALMTAYNYVNGYETAANEELLTNILRNEWGYEGLVMTDWFNQSSHTSELYAGNDVKMPFGEPLNLLMGLNQKSITRAHLVRSTKRVLKAIMKTKRFKRENGLL